MTGGYFNLAELEMLRRGLDHYHHQMRQEENQYNYQRSMQWNYAYANSSVSMGWGDAQTNVVADQAVTRVSANWHDLYSKVLAMQNEIKYPTEREVKQTMATYPEVKTGDIYEVRPRHGDPLRYASCSNFDDSSNSKYVQITGIEESRSNGNHKLLYHILDENKRHLQLCNCLYVQDLIPNKTNMKKLGNMMKKLLDADTQALVKSGYINGDLELTAEGQNALDTIVFLANKAELVKMANERIAEDKEEKSCK